MGVEVADWVRQAHRMGHVPDGAFGILTSPHWAPLTHRVAPSMEPHLIQAADYLSSVDVDDSQVPAALARLISEGDLDRIAARPGISGSERIADDTLEAALSLALAGRPISVDSFIAIFRLSDRVWTATGLEGCGLGSLHEFRENLACEVVDAQIVEAALTHEAGWERIAELYESGIRSTDRMLVALSVPAPFASGAL